MSAADPGRSDRRIGRTRIQGTWAAGIATPWALTTVAAGHDQCHIAAVLHAIKSRTEAQRTVGQSGQRISRTAPVDADLRGEWLPTYPVGC